MSRFKDWPNRTISYLTKRASIEREDMKYTPDQPFSMYETGNLLDEAIEKDERSDLRSLIYQAFLIDHNLLKPMSFRITKISLFYIALFIWSILMFSHSNRFCYFLYGFIFSTFTFFSIVFYFYILAYPTIQYRRDLLRFYQSEMEHIRTVTKGDDTKFLAASRKRKGWVYLSDNYDDNTYKNHNVVLAYAILQNKTLTLYVIDDKFSLKPRSSHDAFNTSLKKMKSCLKIALDLSEFSVEIFPKDLPMGRIWNKKYPIKFSAEREIICQMVIDAPASTFVDFTFSHAEPYVVPSYHRSNPLKIDDNYLYLFGICSREKERWYYKILENCESLSQGVPELNKYVENSARANFNTYIDDIFKKGRWVKEKLVYHPKKNQEQHHNSDMQNASMLMASSMFSLNVILHRIYWDFWREQVWNAKILAKMQRSLDRIELPQFIKSLRADNLNMGDSLPLFFSAEEPELDDDGGVWINFPMYYEGNLSVVINIQINSDLYGKYMEKKSDQPETEKEDTSKKNIPKRVSSLSDELPSLDPDSIKIANELSDCQGTLELEEREEEETDVKILEPHETKGSKIKSSFTKLFSEIVDSSKSRAYGVVKKFCKSAASRFENSVISIHVNLNLLKGTMSVYFPPPPTNRIWYPVE